MAREHKIITWCDPCIQEETYTEGTEFTFSVGVGKPKVISVCTPKHDKLVKQFIELLDTYGIENPDSRKALKKTAPGNGGANPTKIDPRECTLCQTLGLPRKDLKNAQSQAMHHNRSHGVTAAQFAEYEAGELVIASSDSDGRIVLGPAKPAQRRAAS